MAMMLAPDTFEIRGLGEKRSPAGCEVVAEAAPECIST